MKFKSSSNACSVISFTILIICLVMAYLIMNMRESLRVITAVRKNNPHMISGSVSIEKIKAHIVTYEQKGDKVEDPNHVALVVNGKIVLIDGKLYEPPTDKPLEPAAK